MPLPPRPLCLYAWRQARRLARDTLLLLFFCYFLGLLFHTAHTLHPQLVERTQPHAHTTPDIDPVHQCPRCVQSLPGVYTCQECQQQTHTTQLVELTPATKAHLRRQLLSDAMEHSLPLRLLGCSYHASTCFAAVHWLASWFVFDAPQFHPTSVVTALLLLGLVALWCLLVYVFVSHTLVEWRKREAELAKADAVARQAADPLG